MRHINLTTFSGLFNLSFITNSSLRKSTNVGCFSRLHNVSLSSYSYISNNCHLLYVSIGSYVSIGPRVCTINGTHPYRTPSQSPLFHQSRSSFFRDTDHYPIFHDPNHTHCIGASQATVIIEDDVWIGSDVKIMSGVKIGRGSVIGACSLINKDIPPYSIAYGIPAKVVSQRFGLAQITDLEESKWWTFAPQAAFSILLQNHEIHNQAT